MRIALPILSVLLLTACATDGVSKAAFMQGFTPAGQVIPQYNAAMAAPYAAHVRARGFEAVQEAVNANRYVEDAHGDNWQPAALWTVGGDCEDFALAKILELRAQGVDDTLFMVAANRRTGTAHAVAVVNTPDGLDVLDNRRARPAPLADMLTMWAPLYVIDTKTDGVFRPKTTGEL